MSRLATRIGIMSPATSVFGRRICPVHISQYLNPGTLTTLASREGLALVHLRRLPTLSREGLWDRIHMDRRPGLASRLQYLAVSLLRPVFNSPLFSDILHIVFRKPSRFDSSANVGSGEHPMTKGEVV